jgi:hypothetical protein
MQQVMVLGVDLSIERTLRWKHLSAYMLCSVAAGVALLFGL